MHKISGVSKQNDPLNKDPWEHEMSITLKTPEYIPALKVNPILRVHAL